MKYHRFPVSEAQRTLWKNALKHKDAESGKLWDPLHSRVCSTLLASGRNSDDPLFPDYVPSFQLGYETSTSSSFQIDGMSVL